MNRSKDSVRSTIQKRDAHGVIRHGAEWLTLWSDPESMQTEADKVRSASVRRERLEVEHQLAAAARSLSGRPELQIVFDANASGADSVVPRLSDNLSDKLHLSSLRGRVDSYALVQRFHSYEIHRQFAPQTGPVRRLFDVCEQVRCEALGMRAFPGVLTNIVACHYDLLERSDLLNAHLASLIPLSEGLRMVLRDSLVNAAMPSIDTAGFRMWDQWIRARFSEHLGALCEAQDDQTSYTPASLVFINALIKELGSGEGKKRLLQPTIRRPDSDNAEESKDGRSVDRLTEDENGDIYLAGGDLLREALANPPAAVLLQEEKATPPPYSAYTTAHDVMIRATELVDIAALRQNRAELERRYGDYRRDLSRLVAKLQRRLLARQVRDWSFDLDEGLIDASRLDRVIVNPGFSSAFKQERESQFRDSIVSLLIDNSGSMRGKPIEIACLASGMLSAALERCGIACEILGFTTRGWNGGESAKDWARAGRPPEPGRLNDLLHIIYKSPDEPARRSRLAICAMLQSSILKENIDGEALLWASRRLLSRGERRKILIVVSDGAPVDQATLEGNNDKMILDRHLRQVIAEIETSSPIEIAAIGVKHEVSRYYRRSIQVNRVESLGASLTGLIDQLLPC